MLSLIIMTMLGIAQQGHAASCPNPRESSMRLTVTSRRNHTGHWTAQAQLEHGMAITTEDNINTIPWILNLEQSAAHCDRLESIILTATVVAPPPKAGPDYEFHRNVGYYKLHTTPKSWAQARDTCIQEGAHLAIINSEEESKVLQNMFDRIISDKNVPWAFIGFHDMNVENRFVTVFGEPLNSTGFFRWASPKEPNNLGASATNPGEDCGSVHRNGGLNDKACAPEMPFFCEQEPWNLQDALVMHGQLYCEGSEETSKNDEEYLILGSPT